MKRYDLFDASTQSLRYIDRYPKSFVRTPKEPLIVRPQTLTEQTLAVDLASQLGAGSLNLSEINGKRAIGQLLRASQPNAASSASKC